MDPETVDKGKKACGAKTRSGGKCKKPPMVGRARCNLHGGATPRGVNAGSFKHGRYSQDLPTRLAAKYHQFLNDPDRLNLSSEIALIDARISDLAQQTGMGGNWKRVRALWGDLEGAIGIGDKERQAVLAAEMSAIVQEGNAELEVWGQIREMVEERRRLVDSEVRRITAAQQYIDYRQAMVLISAILDTINRHVPDRETRQRIGRDLEVIWKNDTIISGN